jgi:hypothetical protein
MRHALGLVVLVVAGCGGGRRAPAPAPFVALAPQWAAIAGGLGGRVQLVDLASASNGGLCAVGVFQGPAVFGAGEPNETLLGGDPTDFHGFVSAHAGDGGLRWVREIVGIVSLQGIAVGPDGTVFVAGAMFGFGGATFAAGEPGEATLVSSSATGQGWAFVACYGADGTLRWARAAGDAREPTLASGVAASADRCAVVGSFGGSPVFGAGEPGETTLASGGHSDGFVAQYDAATGALVRASRVGGAGPDYLRSVSFSPSDASFLVAGDRMSPSGEAFVVRVRHDGGIEDLAVASGTGLHFASRVRARGDGSFVVAGWFQNETVLGTVRLTPPGSATGALFVAAYDPGGTLAWARVIGSRSNGVQAGVDVATLADGSLAVAASLPDELFLDKDHVVTGSPDSASWPDTAVVLFDADGTPEAWLRVQGDEPETFHAVAAFEDDGSFCVAGYSGSTRITVGDGADALSHDVQDPEAFDAVIAKLQPR